MNARRWKIAGLAAACAVVAFGPFLVVWYLRSSKAGPSLESPDGQMTAEVVFGKRDAKLCRLVVIRKHDGRKIGDSVCLAPAEGEKARLVWLPDGAAVGYVTPGRRVLGFVRLRSTVAELSNEEVGERLAGEMK